MKKALLLAIVYCQITLGFAQNQADYLFSNVSVIPMKTDEVLMAQDVFVTDGKIVSIQKHEEKNTNAKTIINCKGQYIMPSLTDGHVHLPKSDSEIESLVKVNLINGVTKIRSMRGTWDHPKVAEKYDTSTTLPFKMYLAAPPFHKGLDLPQEKIQKFVQTASKYGFDYMKVLSIKNDTIFNFFNQACVEFNMPIVGHFPENIGDSLIFNLQYNCIEHLGGLIGVDKDLLEKRINLIKQKGIYISPTLSWYEMAYGIHSTDYMIHQRGMEIFSDSTKNAWAEATLKYREKLGKEGYEKEKSTYTKEMEERFGVLSKLNKEGIKILLSPDASNKYVVPGFGMLAEMKLYKKAKLSNFEILQAATVNFANYFKDNTYGTLEVGKNADFIFLNENPLEYLDAFMNVEALYFNKVYLAKSQLDNFKENLLNE